ncbi:MAG TPA: spore coat associated protein CotJA [Candidatus Eubacterium faecale]|uniref:Spore coat associated protein CotJA n=1 Tax=Candidatus Eubacterium faecale TaxID=2838568 RepID=A0A9D2MHS8_9FIRM|nr:spore coat associated protein CotJA [Candidatus Eubacterium faecale]
MVTMAYVPFQQHPVLYDDTMTGLCAGTIFPELDKPFIGGGAER